MGLCLSKSKNLDSNVNGHRSGGGGGGVHYQKPQEPPIHYTKSPAPVAAAPPQASPSPRPVLRPDTILVTRSDKEDMKREIQIMQHLSGQANIVEFKGAYEDKHSVHLVMELCAGGELFDRIIAKGHYSEKAASSICRAIVNVVHICHFMGVMHRDLKPENFLLSDKSEKALLKATDFGLSVFIEEGKVYRDIVGSAYYVAPEVLRRRYGKEIDIWSAGVILYILLSGVPPFWAETEKGIFDAILKGEIDFDSQPWPSISRSAKDLVRRMLTQDPKKRITSTQVLGTSRTA
ncbi:hypothetical protein TEA_024738 [Camellia sinensis var. sinensis]|uniref:Protein kinase domain-containing protein n=1 Tax=Camellia sinensis var. sinensis TaxID=542762 RepID=A0A4S4EHQ1_CAMSN|nr:hypothetical protein TEA_024738 [Camellia sinensis var. sinensis]